MGAVVEMIHTATLVHEHGLAAVTMSVLPLALIFILLQKQLVRGIQLGAVKG